VDLSVYGVAAPAATPHEAVHSFMPYIAGRLEDGVRLHAMTRHMLGLFHGRPGGRAWRRVLSVKGVMAGAGLDVVREALAAVTRSEFEPA